MRTTVTRPRNLIFATIAVCALTAIAGMSRGGAVGTPGIATPQIVSAATTSTELQAGPTEWGPALAMLERGRRIFRFDTFGDEAFWGGTLRLHEAIEGARFGGVGPGLSPAAALGVGLKIDAEALSASTVDAIRRGRVNLDDPAVTLALLDANAVVGVSAKRGRDGGLRSVGIQCALCHSTVDNSVARGIGRRLDGWPNRDLNVGATIGLAPDLSAIAELLQTDQQTVRRAGQLGPRQVRCAAVPRREGVPAGWQDRRDAPAGGVRTSRREPSHLYRLGRRASLECLCRQSRDARSGNASRFAAERSGSLPGRRASRVCRGEERS